MTPIEIYDAIFNRFGPQGWWPLSGLDVEANENEPDYANYLKFNPSGSRNDYKQNWPRHLGISPKTDRQRFEVVVGAFLTQNTNWRNVEKALYNLNKQGLLDSETVANAPISSIRRYIKPSGYYNQKALRLKKTAAYLQENYGGNLAKMFAQPTGALRHELLSLHGVGNETADSIILYAANKAKFVVDAYTFRLNERFSLSKAKTYNELQNFFEEGLSKDAALFKEYHALIVELAQENCRKTPLCGGCPLEEKCMNR